MESTRRLVVHDTSSNDVIAVLRRLVRREVDSVEVVLVTYRSTSLPGALGRRVRVIRERTPDAAARRAGSLAVEGARVVTTGGGSGADVTISACLIVKDEEEVLGACLEAVTPFVDEVVVYDTGSTDTSREVARRAGATVVEGYWDDSFGNARNRALEHCTMRWVFFVDADEVAVGEPAMLRERLGRERSDVVPVVVVSTSWAGGMEGDESVIRRIARRTRIRWSGQLHEYMDAAAGVTDISASSEVAPLRLLHSGYQSTVIQDKQKGQRNVDLASAALDSLAHEDHDRPIAVANYGRSLMLAGQVEHSLAVLDELKAPGGNPTVVLAAARAAVDMLVEMGQDARARTWLPVMAEHGESRGNLVLCRAAIDLAAGDAHGASLVLADLPSAGEAGRDKDPWGAPFDLGAATSLIVSVDLALGRNASAGAHLREQLVAAPERVSVRQMFTAMESGVLDRADVVAAAPEQFLEKSLREAVSIGGPAALRWCEAFCAAHPGDHRPVVAGCVIAGREDMMTAIAWAARALEAGIEGFSPLRTYADRPQESRVERATALVVLADAFGDGDALADLVDLLPQLAHDERESLAARCAELGVSVPGGLAPAGITA